MVRDALVWGQVEQRSQPQGKVPVSSSLDSVVERPLRIDQGATQVAIMAIGTQDFS